MPPAMAMAASCNVLAICLELQLDTLNCKTLLNPECTDCSTSNDLHGEDITFNVLTSIAIRTVSLPLKT